MTLQDIQQCYLLAPNLLCNETIISPLSSEKMACRVSTWFRFRIQFDNSVNVVYDLQLGVRSQVKCMLIRAMTLSWPFKYGAQQCVHFTIPSCVSPPLSHSWFSFCYYLSRPLSGFVYSGHCQHCLAFSVVVTRSRPISYSLSIHGLVVNAIITLYVTSFEVCDTLIQ